eukprot:2149399-Prymnesium_polylepis.1
MPTRTTRDALHFWERGWERGTAYLSLESDSAQEPLRSSASTAASNTRPRSESEMPVSLDSCVSRAEAASASQMPAAGTEAALPCEARRVWQSPAGETARMSSCVLASLPVAPYADLLLRNVRRSRAIATRSGWSGGTSATELVASAAHNCGG